MPATSKAQQQFFGLVRAVQKGEIPASKVTSNVRDAAKDTSPADVEDFASTKTKNLPDKVIDGEKADGKKSDKEEKKEAAFAGGHDEGVLSDPREREKDLSYGKKPLKLSPHFRDPGERTRPNEPEKDWRRPTSAQESMSFGDIVARYNEYGNVLRRDKSLSELAQNLASIAEYAEFTLTNETNDWYDKHTISRNIKEMKGYAKEFAKIAQEADEHNMRMSALYDDMGRVLERYFDIYDSTQDEPSDDMMTEFTYEPEGKPPAEVLTTRGEEGQYGVYDGVEETGADPMNERALAYVRERLQGENLVKFDSLPEAVRNEVAWRALGKNEAKPQFDPKKYQDTGVDQKTGVQTYKAIPNTKPANRTGNFPRHLRKKPNNDWGS